MALGKKTKALVAKIMAVAMVICLFAEAGLPASAEEVQARTLDSGTALNFDKNATYAIVTDGGSGKAVNTKVKNWVEDSIVVDGTYNKGTNMLTEETAQFIITPCGEDEQSGLESGEVKVKITCHIGGETCPLRMESGKKFAFADPDGKTRPSGDIAEKYIIKRTDKNTGIIQAASDKTYATVDTGDKAILRFTEKAENKAERFYFAENPKLLNTEYTIEHVKSGKYIKTYEAVGDKSKCQYLTVDGSKDDDDVVFKKAVFGTNNSEVIGKVPVVSFVSKKYGKGIMSAWWDNGANIGITDFIRTCPDESGGWESMQVIPNGDGTVSFKDSLYGNYVTVDKDNYLACGYQGKLTENEKFYIHTEMAPTAVNDLAIDESSRSQTTLELSWSSPSDCIYNYLQLWMKGPDDTVFKKMDVDLSGKSSYQVTNLQPGNEYTFRLRVIYKDEGGNEDICYELDGNEVTAKTRAGEKPATPTNLHITELANGNLKITWDKAEHAKSYKILHAPSMLGKYEEIKEITGTSIETAPSDGKDKYSNYYRIVAINGEEISDESKYISLETEMFGRHTLIFAPTDNLKKISAMLDEVFDAANDYDNDAQFKGEQWQVYFKKGDYTEMACLYLGFYTSFNGLGKLPTDVKLNNIAIPAYLPGGALGGEDHNATCNFWRSAENLSVIDTGNEQGKAGYGAYEDDRDVMFNWAVAQAAPLRRVYSTRRTAYDWNYGWASGGYVADCFIDNNDEKAAGTASGQQFYTRNTKVTGGIYGATLNNFFQGVEAGNQLTAENGERMYKDNGYTNWGIAAPDGGQQVSTQLDSTERISEKPFLYLDENNEYQVFVPAIRENARGISWGDGKANDGMGEGKSLSLDGFYLAFPEDSATVINEQIAKGKNIYFTPGIYHAEVPIEVNRENAILLGSGMTSIIPDNEEMAMKVADLDGIRIEGLIFDAGLSSKYLLQVGTKGVHKSHASNPIILQDLFFRVGGTTDVLTKADDALEINSDDVIGDHFWIWRADHGAGVEWYGNESKHGLIVNGDNVRCYALFNEHFQEYHTLWNGENGATYFYQNETCYDPISQEAWMSHGGTVNGYSSYKVSNDVDKHYAVGLGIYNVFIYTGPSYDGKEVAIQLDNAIEVPNKEGVVVENACIQTFANADGALQKINHIVNGVGGSVSSGYVKDNPMIRGEGWSRKFLLFYNNGKTKYGKETNGTAAQAGKFIGLIACGLDDDDDDRIVQYDKPVEQPADEQIYTTRIEALYSLNKDREQGSVSADSWKIFTDALEAAKKQIEAGIEAQGKKLTQSEISEIQQQINIACTKLESAIMGLTGNPIDEGQVSDVITKPSGTATPKPTATSKPAATPTLTPIPTLVPTLAPTLIPTSVPTLMPTLAPSDKPQTSDEPKPSAIPVPDGTEEPAITPEPTNTPEPDGTLEPANTSEPEKTPAKKVTLNQKKIYVVKGKSIQLKGVMTPDETTDKLSWSSSKKSVASVKNGKVTAKKKGTAKIKVKTTSGKTAACTVYVVKKAKKSKGISLNKKYATVERGTWILLRTSLNPAKSTDTVKWKSSDKKVASVDAYGFVKAKKSGKATITATTPNGKKAKCVVTVNNSRKIDEIIAFIHNAVTTTEAEDFLSDLLSLLKERPAIMKKAGSGEKDGYPDTGKEKEGYQLIWSDEFDGDYGSAKVDGDTGLNLENWSYQYGDGSTDCGNYGWGNKELECYTDEVKNIGVNEDVDKDGINDGLLRITAAYEKEGYSYAEESKKNYTSARIRTTSPTEALFSTTYGYVEARMKLPAVKGAWPAFWMLPQNPDIYKGWPVSGEIDIMETCGAFSDGKNDKACGTLHWGKPYHIYDGSGDVTLRSDYSNFHTYAVDWEPGKITWYYDDVAVKTLTDWESALSGASGSFSFDAPFDQPFYMLLNLAVDSGQFSKDNKAEFQDKIDMYVDYVRVFQKKDGYSEVTASTVSEKEHAVLADGNLVYNGTFDQGDAHLGYWRATDGTAVQVPCYTTEKLADNDISVVDVASKTNYEDIADGAKYYERRAQVSAAGDIEPTIYQPGLKLPSDSYQLMFDMYSTQDTTVTAAIYAVRREGARALLGEMLHSESIPYQAKDSVKKLEWSFETKEAVPDAAVVFRFGKGASVQIDNVVLMGTLWGEMPIMADAPWAADNGSGNSLAFNSKEGVHTLPNVVSGQNWYSPQVISSDFALVRGKKYKLNMKYKLAGTSNNTFEYIIQENGGEWKVFQEQTKLTYNSEKADADGFCTYEVTFTAPESLPNVHLVFGLGNSGATGGCSFSVKDITMGVVYGISYQLDGGRNAVNNPKEYGRGEKNVLLAAPVKDGYDFLGWTVGKAGTDYIKMLPTEKGGNIVLYANWVKAGDMPTDTPKPSVTPKPTDTLSPSATPGPGGSNIGGNVLWPFGTPKPNATPSASGTPRPSETPVSGGTPEPGNTQNPSGMPEASAMPAPSGTSKPGDIPAPDGTSKPGDMPNADSTAAPDGTLKPDGKDIPAKKITLHTKKACLVKGKSFKLKAVMAPNNTADKIVWRSSKKSVATVKNGIVTAKGVGTANITAKTTSGKKAVCTVYVIKKAKKAKSLSLNKKNATLDRGDRILLTPALNPVKSTDTVKWKSSDTQVAVVDAYGFVTAKKSGKAVITATTASGKKAKCTIIVDNSGIIDGIVGFLYGFIK